MSGGNTIPVTIVTGFLGAGKTTLINALLKHDDFSRSAVIINEFGEAPLDHHFVESAADGIIELSNGCLCCTVRGQLVESLEAVAARNPERIVIETTGLADPSPVIQAIIATPSLSGMIRLAGLVTVFDVITGPQMLDRVAEARKQMALADLVVMTRLDVADAENAKRGIEAASSAAPGATTCTRDAFLSDPAGHLESLVNKMPHQPADGGNEHHHHHHNVNRHDERISSVTLYAHKPMQRQQLEMFLDLLLSAHGDHVLRLKGIVDIAGNEKPLVIHASGRRLEPFSELARWPDENRQSRIVVFLEDLKPDFVRQLFEGFMNVPAVDAPDHTALTENPLAIPGFSGKS